MRGSRGVSVPDEELPYDDGPCPEWGTEVNTWPWHPTGSPPLGWWKHGPCPRCGHPTTVELGLLRGEDLVAERALQVDSACACRTTHTTGQTGCGAAGFIDGPTAEDGLRPAAPAPAPGPTARTGAADDPDDGPAPATPA